MLSFILGFLCNHILLAVGYISNSTSFPKPLKREEETECLKRAREGDINARNKLIEHNLRLVAYIAKKYNSKNLENDELISVGVFGLIKAINTFNMEYNTRISSYASTCIDNEIKMYLRGIRNHQSEVYLYDTVVTDKDGDELTYADLVSDKQEDFADIVDTKIKVNSLPVMIKGTLKELEKKILIKRFGLGNYPEMTQMEIARQEGISRSYVSRIEARAIKKLGKKYKIDE